MMRGPTATATARRGLLRRACYLLVVVGCIQLLVHGSSHFRRGASRKAADSQGGPSQALLVLSQSSGSESSADTGDTPDSLSTRLRRCKTFACLREQHAAGSDGKFNFPHFMVVGWQKSASSALNGHFKGHPQALPPSTKEPHFFTHTCSPGKCEAHAQEKYLVEVLGMHKVLDSNMQLAAYEASADYAKNGGLAASTIRSELPWVRVVASMREPISHALSLMNHHLQEPWNTNLAEGKPCLKGHGAYTCLKRYFTEESVNRGFAPALATWIQAFPRDQLFIFQYENMTHPDTMPQVLADLKSFLGMDTHLPKGTLDKKNVRRKDEGWAIQRQHYEEIVELVRPDVQRVADLLAESGLGGGSEWVRLWEEVWDQTLAGCAGDCRI